MCFLYRRSNLCKKMTLNNVINIMKILFQDYRVTSLIRLYTVTSLLNHTQTLEDSIYACQLSNSKIQFRPFMFQVLTTFTGMIWSIKVICSSCSSGYCQNLLVSTDRTSSRCSSKKWVASTRCLHIAKYHFHLSLWSQITVQGSLISGSNTAVSDVLHSF